MEPADRQAGNSKVPEKSKPRKAFAGFGGYFLGIVERPFWVKISSMSPYFLASSAIIK